LLKLNCDKALHKLNWKAVLDFETTIKMTAEWYKSYYENPKEVEKLTYNQISEYMDLFQG
jgi:CDP-glucose 4,6-dehydratase